MEPTSNPNHLPEAPHMRTQVVGISPVPLVDDQLNDTSNDGIVRLVTLGAQMFIQHAYGFALVGYDFQLGYVASLIEETC